MITLGAAAKQAGVSKSTISKAIATGKLSAIRREDKSFAIDPTELARYIEANGHRFQPAQSEQPATRPDDTAELRARCQIAEERLQDAKAALADLRSDRDHWRDVASRLAISDQRSKARRRWFGWW